MTDDNQKGDEVIIDDEDSKIRRNLVWLTSVLILWSIFGISLAEETKSLLKFDKIENPQYIWIVLVFVLYYLLIRFLNNAESNQCWGRIKGRAYEEAKNHISNKFSAEIQKVIDEQPSEIFTKEILDTFEKVNFVRIRGVKGVGYTGPTKWEPNLSGGDLQVSVPVPTTGNLEITNNVSFTLPFLVNASEIRSLRIKQMAKMIFIGNEGVYFLVPIFLWSWAFFVITVPQAFTVMKRLLH